MSTIKEHDAALRQQLDQWEGQLREMDSALAPWSPPIKKLMESERARVHAKADKVREAARDVPSLFELNRAKLTSTTVRKYCWGNWIVLRFRSWNLMLRLWPPIWRLIKILIFLAVLLGLGYAAFKAYRSWGP